MYRRGGWRVWQWGKNIASEGDEASEVKGAEVEL